MDQKTVFISYRRSVSKHLARSIYQDLRMHGWDVFLDVNTIDSGNFDNIILNQIAARAHFILIISPGAMERCVNTDDWLLREMQEAIRVDRNVVPIVEEGASFSKEVGFLPEDLREKIRRKNALPLHHFYFDAAMDMLRNRFLKLPEYIETKATPDAEVPVVDQRKAELDKLWHQPEAKTMAELFVPEIRIKETATRSTKKKDYVDWKLEIDTTPDILEEIEAVRYKLHPSFSKTSEIVRNRSSRFLLKATGWGTFSIPVDIYFKDESIGTIEYMLQFDLDG